MSKLPYIIEVSDKRGKFAPRRYTVWAEREFLAYGPATEQFIKDNGYRPRNPTERMSQYYARFYNTCVGIDEDQADSCKNLHD